MALARSIQGISRANTCFHLALVRGFLISAGIEPQKQTGVGKLDPVHSSNFDSVRKKYSPISAESKK
jgi:hypothetical protein